MQAGKALALLYHLAAPREDMHLDVLWEPAHQQLLANHVAYLLETASQHQASSWAVWVLLVKC